jgi:hypothetical protein
MILESGMSKNEWLASVKDPITALSQGRRVKRGWEKQQEIELTASSPFTININSW